MKECIVLKNIKSGHYYRTFNANMDRYYVFKNIVGKYNTFDDFALLPKKWFTGVYNDLENYGYEFVNTFKKGDLVSYYNDETKETIDGMIYSLNNTDITICIKNDDKNMLKSWVMKQIPYSDSLIIDTWYPFTKNLFKDEENR